MTHFHSEFEYDRGLERDPVPALSGHPDDILDDPSLTTQQKRALLASWASDANAVPHLPTLRQLPPDGSIVKFDDILHALKVLDGRVELPEGQASLTSLVWRPFKRRPHTWPRMPRRPGDRPDDDPPPAPAVAGLRPKSGDGDAVAFACAQSMAA